MIHTDSSEHSLSRHLNWALSLTQAFLGETFLLAHLSKKRRLGLLIYDRMNQELDDIDDSDLPRWHRIDVPPLTQKLLLKCKGSPDAISPELLQLRHRHRKFRKTLTEQTHELVRAKTRGEKRRVRTAYERAWNALLGREDRVTRLVHQAWELLKEPTKFPHKVVDLLVKKDELDQAINRVQGLTDLWNEMKDAPILENNMALLKEGIGVSVDPMEWSTTRTLASRLEMLMRRDEDPELR